MRLQCYLLSMLYPEPLLVWSSIFFQWCCTDNRAFKPRRPGGLGFVVSLVNHFFSRTILFNDSALHSLIKYLKKSLEKLPAPATRLSHSWATAMYAVEGTITACLYGSQNCIARRFFSMHSYTYNVMLPL